MTATNHPLSYVCSKFILLVLKLRKVEYQTCPVPNFQGNLFRVDGERLSTKSFLKWVRIPRNRVYVEPKPIQLVSVRPVDHSYLLVFLQGLRIFYPEWKFWVPSSCMRYSIYILRPAEDSRVLVMGSGAVCQGVYRYKDKAPDPVPCSG